MEAFGISEKRSVDPTKPLSYKCHKKSCFFRKTKIAKKFKVNSSSNCRIYYQTVCLGRGPLSCPSRRRPSRRRRRSRTSRTIPPDRRAPQGPSFTCGARFGGKGEGWGACKPRWTFAPEDGAFRGRGGSNQKSPQKPTKSVSTSVQKILHPSGKIGKESMQPANCPTLFKKKEGDGCTGALHLK